MGLMDIYLLLGLLVHVAFLGLTDWLAYHHLMVHGYDHTVLILGVLNVAIFFGLYYLVIVPLRRRVHLRRLARETRRQRASH
jgi:hypothetical protein